MRSSYNGQLKMDKSYVNNFSRFNRSNNKCIIDKNNSNFCNSWQTNKYENKMPLSPIECNLQLAGNHKRQIYLSNISNLS